MPKLALHRYIVAVLVRLEEHGIELDRIVTDGREIEVVVGPPSRLMGCKWTTSAEAIEKTFDVAVLAAIHVRDAVHRMGTASPVPE